MSVSPEEIQEAAEERQPVREEGPHQLGLQGTRLLQANVGL